MGVMNESERLRFAVKIDQSGDCWLWTGARNPNGYGSFSIGGRSHSAHRLAYESAKGPIPEGHHIDHTCRTKRCVNPDHLEAVTPQENNARRVFTCHECGATRPFQGSPQ